MKLKEINNNKENFRKIVIKFVNEIDTLAKDVEPDEEKDFTKKFNKTLKILDPIYKEISNVTISTKTKAHTISALVRPRVTYIKNIINNVDFDTAYEQSIVTDHINIMISDLER